MKIKGLYFFLKTIFIFLFFLFIPFFFSCEKEIDLEIPVENNLLVVEGNIEPGQPPYVILTKSSGYFQESNLSSFLNSFVHNASVSVTVNDVSYPLPELCSADIPSAYRPFVAEFLGIPPEDLAQNNYCLYTVPFADVITGNYFKGTSGLTYKLTIESEGKTYFSHTRIPEIVPLDSVWYKPIGPDSAFGFAWAHLTDPDTAGNAYRWFAKRISHGTYGQVKDYHFVPPYGSTFDDRFINGKSFDFAYDRGNRPSDEGVELPGEKQHFFKTGDTIVVKFCTIDSKVSAFLKKYENEIWNNGNPFASPTTLPTNIENGALGLWAGYGVSFDTIVAGK